MQVDCDDPAKAAGVIGAADIAADVARADVADGDAARRENREAVAELNRRLVEVGISVYSLQEVRTSLEDWFLSVTSRFGEQA